MKDHGASESSIAALKAQQQKLVSQSAITQKKNAAQSVKISDLETKQANLIKRNEEKQKANDDALSNSVTALKTAQASDAKGSTDDLKTVDSKVKALISNQANLVKKLNLNTKQNGDQDTSITTLNHEQATLLADYQKALKDHGASTDTIAALKTKTDSVIAAIQKA